MKTLTKISAFAILMVGSVSSIFAQATATASATAVIIAPIAISKTVDMVFGNAAVTASLGTVALAPAGTRVPSGGVTLPGGGNTGSPTGASFNVTGEPLYTYAITLPGSDLTITHTNTINTMVVNTFISSPTVGAGGALSAGGAQTLTVGATLHVAGNQLAGTYSNASFPVTVNYN